MKALYTKFLNFLRNRSNPKVLRTDLVTYKSIRKQVDLVNQLVIKPDFMARNNNPYFDKINLHEYNLDLLSEEAKQKIVYVIHEDNIIRANEFETRVCVANNGVGYNDVMTLPE